MNSMRGFDSSARSFLQDLDRIGARAARAQDQISSGKRLRSAEDNPAQVQRLLESRAGLADLDQSSKNISRLRTEIDGGERALTSAVDLLQKAVVAGTQGANGTTTTATRLTLADQIGSILEQMGQLSASTAGGHYLFSGDTDQQAPYTIDLTLATPVGSYAGSAVTRQVRHPSGTLSTIGRTAQQIFDSPTPGKNVFAALVSLRAGLLADDQAAIQTAMTDMRTAGDHLNSELATYGSYQNQLQQASDYASQQTLQLKTELSSIEDTDFAAAALELGQSRTQQDAALAGRAKMQRHTLFDYLG